MAHHTIGTPAPPPGRSARPLLAAIVGTTLVAACVSVVAVLTATARTSRDASLDLRANGSLVQAVPVTSRYG
ncbi:hypothetical protein ABZ754_18400 [Micromonospora purpureochromogenes]|uniref:hypothetical protein n=1 Tax=Micromonospora purpureochromogenes TaxID=47872 RepID=UPI00340201F5